MVKRGLAFILAVAGVGFAGCSSTSTPTRTAVVAVSYSPNPVPWSAGPGSSSICAAAANVWKYTTTFTETGGVAATLTSVVTTIDGVAQPTVSLNFAVPASGSLVNSSEICFGTTTQHTFQHAFSGTDSQGKAITFSGVQIVLSAK
jgi:hypothetical protein